VGTIFFDQDIFTYLSFLAILFAWFWIFRTAPGLTLRSVGERPETAFARGGNVNRLRYLYTAFGGAWWAWQARPIHSALPANGAK